MHMAPKEQAQGLGESLRQKDARWTHLWRVLKSVGPPKEQPIIFDWHNSQVSRTE